MKLLLEECYKDEFDGLQDNEYSFYIERVRTFFYLNNNIYTYKNKDINLQQVKDGYAWVYKKYSNNQTYYKEETKAKESKKGLWIEKNAIAPWEFRKQKKSKN